MDKKEAYILLGGKLVQSPEIAKEIVKLLGVDVKIPILKWKSGKDAVHKYDIYPTFDGPGEGVVMANLGRSIADKLDLVPGKDYQLFVGRGSQAFAVSKAIREKLEGVTDEKVQ